MNHLSVFIVHPSFSLKWLEMVYLTVTKGTLKSFPLSLHPSFLSPAHFSLPLLLLLSFFFPSFLVIGAKWRGSVGSRRLQAAAIRVLLSSEALGFRSSQVQPSGERPPVSF